MIITPAKNEERLLPFLIESVVRQTILPQRWVIIDDGSTDSTGEQVDAAAGKYPWIQPQHLSPDRVRKRGGASVVMQYLRPDLVADVDYILRLDADLSFKRDFVELLLVEFERDLTLGIAGAVLLERHGRTLRAVRLP